MKNILYVKIFDNGKMYVGITNNFDRRMYQHQWSAYSENSNLQVHRAMRKYGHRTEIWAEGISDRDLIFDLEKQTIQQLRELGLSLYNTVEGGLAGLGEMYGLSGVSNPNSKPAEYYESNETTRQNFKRTCIRQGWSFYDFDEIFSSRVSRKDGIRKDIYYTYKKKGEDW